MRLRTFYPRRLFFGSAGEQLPLSRAPSRDERARVRWPPPHDLSARGEALRCELETFFTALRRAIHRDRDGPLF
jgi:hypothetical protein